MATDNQREALIAEICKSLQLINKVSSADLGLAEVESWSQFINNPSETLVSQLKGKGITDDTTAKRVLHTVSNNVSTFDGSKLFPAHWDVQFDNFIVNDDFKLQAIIDHENVELTSLDCPLFVIQKP